MSKRRRPRRPSEKKEDDEEEDHPLDGLKRWTTLAPERFSYAWARGGKDEEVRRLTARDMSSRLKKIRGELERKFEAKKDEEDGGVHVRTWNRVVSSVLGADECEHRAVRRASDRPDDDVEMRFERKI